MLMHVCCCSRIEEDEEMERECYEKLQSGEMMNTSTDDKSCVIQ